MSYHVSMNQYDHIQKVQEIISGHNFESFIDSGTLLGFIRDSSIISWDNDVDLAIIQKTDLNLKNLCNSFKEEGYKVSCSKWGILLEKKDLIETNIKIYRRIDQSLYTIYQTSDADLLLLKKLCEIIYTDSFSISGNKLKEVLRKIIRFISNILPEFALKNFLKPKSYVSIVSNDIIEPIKDYSLEGCLFKIPSLPEEYLAKKYGENWQTPIQNYSYKTDDGTISEYKMDLSDVLYVLQAIKKIFDKHEALVYLSAGTLLGAIRDKGIIPWDYDIDLASKEIFLDKSDLIAKDLNDMNITVFISKMTNVMALYYKGVTVDIDFYRGIGNDLLMPMKHINNKFGALIYFVDWMFCFEPKTSVLKSIENRVNYSMPRHLITFVTKRLPKGFRRNILNSLKKLAVYAGNTRGIVRIPNDLVGSCKSISIFNDEWLVPQNYEDYLSLYYGNWKVQEENYQYFDSSGKIISSTQIPDLDWEHKL